MSSEVISTTLIGIEALGVRVETQIFGSLRRFSIVGLPDGILRESKDRVRCALENSGFSFPTREVIVSLAPASLPKHGSGFDLAIALSILAANGEIDFAAFQKTVVLGELALDGTVKPVSGALASACYARERNFSRILLAPENARIAAMASGIKTYAIRNLLEAVALLNNQIEITPVKPSSLQYSKKEELCGFGDVCGQYEAKRALMLSASGGHNVLLEGPPGAGKSMLAQRLVSILPQLGFEEALEVTKIYSTLSNKLVGDPSVLDICRVRPFRAPHHNTSMAGLIGGGPRPQPGEVSLAHRGVLFLDELPEFKRDALEALREPLEIGTVGLSRARFHVIFPSAFIFIAAMNPCPCGYHRSDIKPCQCLPTAIERYVGKISGPLLDRIDLRVWVPPVSFRELRANNTTDPTAEMKSTVAAVRKIQEKRFQSQKKLNAMMDSHDLKRFCKLSNASAKTLEAASCKLHLSARGYTRVLKVSRTIADSERTDELTSQHLLEALSYRLPAA